MPTGSRPQPDISAAPDMNGIDLAIEPDFPLGNAQVRPALLRLVSPDDEKKVEPRVMQLLVTMAGRLGDTVSRDELIERCWAGRLVGEDAIQRAVGKLRRLGEWCGAFRVETIPRVGYRLFLSDSAASPASPTPPLLAVLPFAALSSDPDLGFFAEGLADEILHMLARGTRIRLIGRASSFQFRGDRKAAATVQAALGATHLLDGSVQKSADRYRILVQLIDAGSGTVLWSDGFDRTTEDLMRVQVQVSAAVANALHHQFSPEYRGLVAPVLHEQIVRAFRHALDGPITLADVSQIDALAAKAPDYALGWAYASEARNYLRMRPEISDDAARKLFEEQRDCADRAMAIDPGLAPALLAHGALQPPCGAFTERERIFRAADSYGWPLPPLTYLLLQVGRSSEALAAAERGREREPLVGPVRMGHQLALAQLGKIDAWQNMVIADLRRHPPAPHEWATIAQLAALFGRWSLVDTLVDGTGSEAGPPAGPIVAEALAMIETIRDPTVRRREQLVKALETRLNLVGHAPFFPLTVAAAIIDRDIVMDIVARSDFEKLLLPGARLGGAPYNTAALFLPHAAPLRGDPGFTPLCRRLGLIRHWNEVGRMPDGIDGMSLDLGQSDEGG